MFATKPREGMPSPRLDREAFVTRFRAQFPGTSFEALGAEAQVLHIDADQLRATWSYALCGCFSACRISSGCWSGG